MTDSREAASGPDHRSVELRSLIELSQILNSSLDVTGVLNNCLLTPMGRMLISRGIALAANEEAEFSVKVVKGLPKEIGEMSFHFTYDFRAPILVADLPDEACKYKSFFQSVGIELIVPMTSPSRMVGALCLGGKMTKTPFIPRELEFLNSLSNIASTALENALIFQKLESVNRRLDKKVQELNTLFEIGKELNSTLDKAQIINILQFTIMGEMAVNKMLMFLQEDDDFELVLNKWPDSEAIIHAVDKDALRNRLARLKETVQLPRDTHQRGFGTLAESGVYAIVPMRIQDETSGVLLLGPRLSNFPYEPEDLEFLSTLCNRVLVSLENVRLFEETLEKQRLEEEMAIAKEIQQRLLPGSFPESVDYEIYGFNLPSRQVGGDYFDCIALENEKIALAIGDVSGKGVGASLLMSNLHAGLHTLLQSNLPMNEMITRLNDLIYRNTNFDKFITFFYSEFDLLNCTLTYVNAGHNPPLLFHDDGSFELLDKGGLIIGMLPDVSYETGTVALRKGDLLIAITDGVTEARSINDEMYDDFRLQALISRVFQLDISLHELADMLISEVETFCEGMPQADDITMLALKIRR
jgi:phosphoserine phosphatase RsbU/P